MSKGKGIVKETPTVTGHHPGIVAVVTAEENTYGINLSSTLNYWNPAPILNTDDPVEFTIKDATTCSELQPLEPSKGEAVMLVDARGGQVKVTYLGSNDFGVKMGDVLWYSLLSPYPNMPVINPGDIISFIITGQANCTFIKVVQPAPAPQGI